MFYRYRVASLPQREIREMRLLTEEEVGKSTRYGLISYMSEYLKIAKAQDIKTHKETLKAVGEWVQEHSYEGFDTVAFIEALKRGEMPEETK